MYTMKTDVFRKVFEEVLGQAERDCGPLNRAETEVLRWTLGDQREPKIFSQPRSQDRTLRSIFVRWIIGATSAKPASAGLHVLGAHMDEPLDLANLKFAFPLRLKDCELNGGIDLRGATTGFLDFSNSKTTLVRATGVKVHGDFRLKNGFEAREGMYIGNAVIYGNLDCRGAHFGKIPHVRIKGVVRQQYDRMEPAIIADKIEIHGNLLCGATVTEAEEERRFTTVGGISLVNSEVKGMVSFRRATVHSDSVFAIRANAMRVGSSVLMRDNFTARGQVRMTYATIGGKLDLTGGQFFGPKNELMKGAPAGNPGKYSERDKAAVVLDGIRITGNLDIGNEPGKWDEERDEKFTCHSEFRMRSARIQGDIHIDYARFLVTEHFKDGSALSMAESKIDGRVEFCKDVEFERVIHMPYCRIGGSLTVESKNEASMTYDIAMRYKYRDNCHAICAYSINVEGDVRFGGSDAPEAPKASVRSSIDLSHARIRRSVTFRKGNFSVKLDRGMPTRSEGWRAIILDGADVGRHVMFTEGCSVLGTISLHGIRIGRDLKLTGCQFMDNTKMEPGFWLPTDYKSIDLANGFIAGDLDWRGKRDGDSRPRPSGENEDLRLRPPGIVVFSRLQIRRLRDDEAIWPELDDKRCLGGGEVHLEVATRRIHL